MRVTIAVHGTRGDVEPCVVAALELQCRGHEVDMAVPPNLVRFVESVSSFSPRPYGPDSDVQMRSDLIANWYSLHKPRTFLRDARDYVCSGWQEMSRVLMELSGASDLIVTGTPYQEVAANVAESRGLPFAALHIFPARANRAVLPVRLPRALARAAWTAGEWCHWRVLKPADDEQRRSLGLPVSPVRASKRMRTRGALHIQAYDQCLFPGLDDEWRGAIPFAGTLTLEQRYSSDQGVMDWIAQGPPPVYFGFGSMPLREPVQTLQMIRDVCASMDLRALVLSSDPALQQTTGDRALKIVGVLNHARAFPSCLAVVHHGGSGTTAAGLRAGVPALILWHSAEQPIWGHAVTRLGAGLSRSFAKTTRETLREDLRGALAPERQVRARMVASQMVAAPVSRTRVADLLEAAVTIPRASPPVSGRARAR